MLITSKFSKWIWNRYTEQR